MSPPPTSRPYSFAELASRFARPAPINEPPGEPSGAPIIAFCHLSWRGVWQRPQQLLSRLARNHPVLFVETYCRDVPASETHVYPAPGHPNVTILEMHLPAAHWADGGFIDGERRRLLRQYRRGGKLFPDPILWFNDPMAVTAFAGNCGEQAIVYDCMDELAQFRGAPPELRQRERTLLAQADVVFCGGRKMRDKRLPLNSNCHFYGTGVDCTHFGSARSEELAVDSVIAALSGKVFGYFGVIDERIDYELLERLADACPDCSIAMVGPFAKVDPATLPQRPNLHWLGSRAYADLPAITKGFAVCLMPFARNEATEYINPTKALEYMATGRPVVSTALDEVKTNFGTVSGIAQSHEEFIELCKAAATSPDATLIQRGLDLASQNTWESIVGKMERHVAEAIAGREESMLSESTGTDAVTAHPLSSLKHV